MSLFLHQIWRNVALHHLLSNGSSAVNGCRQNESPNREICTDQASFTIQNSSKQICVWILKREDNSGWPSSLEELLWIMDWILVYRWNVLMDLFLANTQLWLEWCGLLDVFISCLDSFWRHPFTAEHPLLRHWRSDTFLQIWWRKTHPNLGRPEVEHIFSKFSFLGELLLSLLTAWF